MKYYSCYNNGVQAIVSEDVMRGIEQSKLIQKFFEYRDADIPANQRFRPAAAYKGLKHLAVPVFTFASSERVMEQPWFTGTIEEYSSLRRHIRANGDCIEEGWFYIPFSNGLELGLNGENAMKSELAYVTTGEQFREAFGISIAELQTKVAIPA